MKKSEGEQKLPESTVRRSFIKGIRNVGILYLFSQYGAPIIGEALRDQTDSLDEKRSQEIGQTMIDQFGLTHVSVDGKIPLRNQEHFKADPVSSFGLWNVSNQLTQYYLALTRYPPAIFNSLRNASCIWGITGGYNWSIKENGEWLGIGGTLLGDDPTGFHICLPLDVDYPHLMTRSLQETLHHEFWHLITSSSKLREAKSLPKINMSFSDIDYKFGLDPSRFDSYKVADGCEVPNPPGFADCYGMRNSKEDGATIAEQLMTGNRTLWERSVTDPALMAKIDLVRNVYSQISGGRMNGEYFKGLSDGKTPHWDWPILP